jgi:RNA polymerase-binding transcription factor DksA
MENVMPTTGTYTPPHSDPAAHLSARRYELLRQLEALDPTHELDRSHEGRHLVDDVVVQERHSTVAVVSVLQAELRQIERALQWAADGHYGICEDCDAVIAPRRMQVVPAATRCISCQERNDVRR